MKKDKILDSWWFWLIAALIGLIAPFLIKAICVAIKATIFQTDSSKSFYGSYLSFFGTIWLGIIVMRQNYRYKIENDKTQEELKRLNKQANEISDRSIKVTENAQRPIIDFITTEDNSDSVFIELYPNAKGNSEITVRVYMHNVGQGVMKRCFVDKAELSFTNGYYVSNDKHKENNTLESRSILPNGKLYYHIFLNKRNNMDKIAEMNTYFENNAPGTMNGKALTEGMYIIKLFFTVHDLSGTIYKQNVWCFFKQYTNQEKFTIWNKIIEIL